jgi:hypothetical protein
LDASRNGRRRYLLPAVHDTSDPVRRHIPGHTPLAEQAIQRQAYVRTVCRHVFIPDAVASIARTGDSVYCPRCGDWKAVEHKATQREITNEILGRDIDYQNPPLPDDPPF